MLEGDFLKRNIDSRQSFNQKVTQPGGGRPNPAF